MHVQGEDFTYFEECNVKRERVCAMEIWVELFSGDPKMLNSYISKELNDILRQIDEWKNYDKSAGKLSYLK